jgi:hypothetical protein
VVLVEELVSQFINGNVSEQVDKDETQTGEEEGEEGRDS